MKPVEEVKPDEPKAEEAKPEEAKPTEEAKPAEEMKPEEAKPEEAKPEEAKPEEAKPTEEAKPVEEMKPEEAKPEEAPVAEEAPKEESAPAEMKEAPVAEPAPEAAPAEEAKPEEAKPEVAAPAEVPVAAATVKPELPAPVVGTVSAGAARVVDGQDPEPLKNFEVNALVLSVGDKRVAFSSADLPGLDRSVHDAVSAKLAAAGSKIDPAGLMIAATGANTGWKKGVLKGTLNEALFGKFDEVAFNAIVDTISQALLSAEASLAPAEYLVGEADATEFHKPVENASPTLDSALGVLLVQDQSGAPLGAILNYAIMPPVEFGTGALNARGVPGRIVEQVRAKTKADLPVVFFNGAAEDVTVNLGETVEAKLAASEKIAALALDSLKGASPKRESSLAAATWEVTLPPSLLGDILVPTALVTEIQLSGERFVTMPGLPAAQIGMLLRVKALSQGSGQAFLCSLTNDFQGIHTGISEYFSESQRAMMAFHGPLMIKWYADNLVLGAGEADAWKMAPELADRTAAFEAGLAQGAQRKDELLAAWKEAEVGLGKLANMVLTMREKIEDIPEEVSQLISTTPKDKLNLVGRQAAATYLRISAADYTPDQRTTLMGISDAVGLPYDAVLLMDVLSKPASLPQQVQAILALMQLKGHKILEQ